MAQPSFGRKVEVTGELVTAVDRLTRAISMDFVDDLFLPQQQMVTRAFSENTGLQDLQRARRRKAEVDNLARAISIDGREDFLMDTTEEPLCHLRKTRIGMKQASAEEPSSSMEAEEAATKAEEVEATEAASLSPKKAVDAKGEAQARPAAGLEAKEAPATAVKIDRDGCDEHKEHFRESKSLRIQAINWAHVIAATYLGHTVRLWTMFAFALVACGLWSGAWQLPYLAVLVSNQVLAQLLLAAVLVMAYMGQLTPSVYCLESSVFVPPKEWQFTRDEILTCMKAQQCFTESSIEFMRKILANSGTGESTAWPPIMFPCRDGETPSTTGVVPAREEAEAVIFPIVRDVLKRTGLQPKQIDFLIINCSLFSPTPSLCALVSHEFGLREDVRSYNLGGMGCSANGIAVDLAKQLLQNQPGSRALVISTENLTQNLYRGNEKAWLLQNTLFRCGGCALVMSSRASDASRAKYKLLHTFRTQISDEQAYKSVVQAPDGDGNVGVALSKEIIKVAGRAMKRNFTQLGPHILPLREQAKVVANRCASTGVAFAKKAGLPYLKDLQVAGYMPKFARGIEHFCIHTGGRAVIEGVQQNLGLTDEQVAPSFRTLEDFGNTSSSSVWYEAEWIERHGGLRVGDRILQLAFGSGFKCNSAVWVTLRVDRKKQGVPLKATSS